jgi:hypothetical protein
MNTPDQSASQSPPAAPPAPPAAPPKAKRWKKILLVAGCVVMGLVLFLLIAGPFIIGGVAKSQIVSIVDEKLQATAVIGSVSFSWSGHVQIDDLRLVPKNFSDPLIEVKKVDVTVNLGSAIGGKVIADVEVVAPRILVEKGPDGKFNYEFPTRPSTPSGKPHVKGEPPFVQAAVRVRDGEVRVRGKGRETVYQNVTVDAKVDTLQKPISFNVSLTGPQKDTVKVNGSFDLDTRSGPATVVLDRFSLRNLTGAARAYSDIGELDGTITGSLDYQIKGAPRFSGRGLLEIADFKLDQTVLDRLTISHDGAIDDKGSGRHLLAISSGKAIDAKLVVVVADGFNTRLVKTELKADLDLEALGGVLRATGKLPKDLALSGAVSIRGACHSKGPTQADLDANKLRVAAEVDVTATAANLDVTMAGKRMKVEALKVHHAGTLDENGTGRNTLTLEVGKALGLEAKVDVADAMGKSPTVMAGLTGWSDLGELGRLLEKMIGLKQDMALEGAAKIRGGLEVQGAEAAKGRLDLTIANVVAVDTKQKKRYEIDPRLSFLASGSWDAKTKTATAQAITLSSSFATVNAKGGAALGGNAPVIQDSTFELKADLEKLASKLALFMEDAPTLKGSVAANASYAEDRYGLDATIKGLKTETAGPIDATIAQKGVLSLSKGGALKIETGVVTSSAADLQLSGEVRNVMEPTRDGEIRLDAAVRPVELTKWMPDLALTGPEIKATGTVSIKPGQIAATVKSPAFTWVAKGASLKGNLESQITKTDTGITGTTKITNLEVVDDKKNTVKDPGLTIVHDIGLADQNKSIDLRKVEAASSFLHGSATGRILRRDPVLEFHRVRLALKYHPGKLGAFAKPWLPGTLEGKEEKSLDVALDGKASSAQGVDLLRGTTGAIDLDLATFTMDGLSLSGKTRLDLKDGKLVSATPLMVNKGNTDLKASLDFNPPEKKPQSTIAFNAKDVDANGQMGPLLERINPIFHTSGVDAKVDGKIQSDFHLLWSGPINPDEKDWVAASSKSLSGTGLFSVQNLNIGGSPVVGQIMSALGQDNAMQGEVIATQIRIANGRCEYDNMILRGSRKDPAALQRDQQQLAADRQQLEADRPHLSPREHDKRAAEMKQREEDLPFRYTLRFTGWVGFDRKLQLRVLMPMSPAMAKSHPGLARYIGTSFWVDLTGTANSPRLDVGKMLSEAAKRAAEGVLMDKLDDALKKLLDKKKKDEKKQ